MAFEARISTDRQAQMVHPIYRDTVGPTTDEAAFYETGYRNGWDAAVEEFRVALTSGSLVGGPNSTSLNVSHKALSDLIKEMGGSPR